MYEYKASVLRVVDGDTIDVMMDLGFDTWVRKRIRLYGINCPETRTRDKKEKKAGLKAKALVENIVTEYKNTCRIKSKTIGKYGRVVAEVFFDINKEEYICLNDLLLDTGNAVPYMEDA